MIWQNILQLFFKKFNNLFLQSKKSCNFASNLILYFYMNTIINKNIKNILRSQNNDLGWLSDALGISRQSLHSRLNGNITIKNLQQIASLLNVTVADIVKTDTTATPEPPQEPTATPSLVCPVCNTPLVVSVSIEPKEPPQ